MYNKGFTIIEIVVVFCVILCATFLVLPSIIDNTKQAKLTATWVQKYSDISYMFSVVKVHSEMSNTVYSKDVFLEHLKAQVRVVSKLDGNYKVSYKNKRPILENSRYFIKDYLLLSDDKIVGFKWLNKNCLEQDVCAILQIDVNGIKPPNELGSDVFGVDVTKGGIAPYGKGLDQDVLKSDCSRRGMGAYCSYYYLIGGSFE